jgi:serine/threonine-protein kinase TTK/MPS1
VYRVMAENFKLLALKRVKLEDADEAAVRGYKGEIDLLQKLKNVDRVVRLYDWEVDEQRQVLSVVSYLHFTGMSSLHLNKKPRPLVVLC